MYTFATKYFALLKPVHWSSGVNGIWQSLKGKWLSTILNYNAKFKKTSSRSRQVQKNLDLRTMFQPNFEIFLLFPNFLRRSATPKATFTQNLLYLISSTILLVANQNSQKHSKLPKYFAQDCSFSFRNSLYQSLINETILILSNPNKRKLRPTLCYLNQIGLDFTLNKLQFGKSL